MSSLLVHCHGENWKSPTWSFRRSGKAKRTFQGAKKRLMYSCWAHNIKTSAEYYATFKKPQKYGKFVVRQQKGVLL